MNKIWLIMVVLSSAVLIVINPEGTLNTMLEASSDAVSLCINLCGIYAVWLGLLEILDASGLSEKLAKLLKPLIKKLFKGADEKVHKDIAINMSANMLGLGNAATPYGIRAMKGMDDGSGVATRPMIMLMVLNATSIQLLPTTVIGMRAVAGSVSPSAILWPTIVSTFIPTILGILLVACIYRKKRQKNG